MNLIITNIYPVNLNGTINKNSPKGEVFITSIDVHTVKGVRFVDSKPIQVYFDRYSGCLRGGKDYLNIDSINSFASTYGVSNKGIYCWNGHSVHDLLSGKPLECFSIIRVL